MKRIAIGTLVLAAVVAIVATGVSLARPLWVPAWARINPERLPAWARFGGQAAAPAEDAGLYCKEHGVPEKFCTLCHEELAKTLPLCEEHGGLPEAICTLCHPEAETKYKLLMCKEHGLPEHFCGKCGKGPSASANLPDDGWCATHNKPEATCPECLAGEGKAVASRGQSPKVKVCRQPLPTVKLASAKLVRQVGFRTAAAVEETHAHKLVANAETAYDANRYAEVSPRIGGYIREVRVDLGKAVRQGDILAVVDSAEVSSAKTQFLTAQATVKLAQVTADRTRSLTRSGSVAGKAELEVMTALNQAQAAAMDAEQKLRNLGFGDADLARIARDKDTRNLLDVAAPIGGSVVLRHAVKGEAVQPTTQLLAIADTSRMWLWIDLYESDVARVAPGQPVSFTISGGDAGGEGFVSLGEVTWIGTEVNQTTRTTRVRAELANPNGRLRANQFGQAEIQVGKEHKAVVVPKEAVQRKDNVDLVFLPAEANSYRPQRVTTRPTDRPDFIEVTWGLKPGQRVVTTGAFLLKTEIMKGAIGAGCCD